MLRFLSFSGDLSDVGVRIFGGVAPLRLAVSSHHGPCYQATFLNREHEPCELHPGKK